MSGSATSEGALTLSADGRYLSLAGYDAAAGTTGIAGTLSATVNRVAGPSFNFNMNADLSTKFPTFYNANNIRAAVSNDGSQVWTAGPSTGLAYSDFGGANQAQVATTNSRVVNIFNNSLYVSSMSAARPRALEFAGGLATSGPQTVTLLTGTGTSGTGTPSPYDFWFANPTTLYVADDRSVGNGGGLQKWTFNAGLNTWQLAYTLTGQLSAGLRGLAGTTDGAGNNVLYAVTADATLNKLVAITDTGAGAFFTTCRPPVPTPSSAASISPRCRSQPPWRCSVWAKSR